MVKDGAAYAYARWCLDKGNRYPGKYVKKQAKKWIDIADGKTDDYVDEDQYEIICNVLKLMQHPDLHESIYETLEDYAWLLIVAVLCTKKCTGARKYETVVLEIARKNFKTFNSAIIFILLMLTEPKFSRFFSVAPDLKLSSEIKLAIKKIIKSSPALVEAFKIKVSNIECMITESDYTALAYSQDRMDGKLANAYLADEAGALDSYPVEAMRSSQITLKDKLGIIISTQYPNDNNVFADEVDICKKTLDDMPNGDDTYFALLYEPDEELLKDDGWKTEDLILYQANPVVVKNELIFDNLKRRRNQAILYENKKENFLCKHCNIQYKGLGAEGYVDIDKVRQCKVIRDLGWWRGRRVYLGMDLSQTDDNTSVAMVTEEDGVIYAYVMCFLPHDKIDIKTAKENVNYTKMIKLGYAIDCGDEVIDYSVVEKWVQTLEKRMGVEIVQLGYDRYNAISSVQKFEAGEGDNKGIECVEIKQHSSTLHPATKLLKEKILQKEFEYDENDLLEINFQNARCVEDTNLNKYVNKKRSKGKVDMVVSLINAVYLLQQEMMYGNNFIVQC